MATYGGAREGAGRKKGGKNSSTIDREEARKYMQAYIIDSLEPLLQAQRSLARGLQFVYKIEEEKDDKGRVLSRKHVQLTGPEEIGHALDVLKGFSDAEDGEYYYLTSKQPDVRAIDSMLDRAFGKATQSLEMDNPSQNEELKKINTTLKQMFTNVKSRKSQAKG